MTEDTCWYCGKEAQALDHIVPRKLGGSNARSNLRPACWFCNSSKGSLTVEQFRRVRSLRIAAKKCGIDHKRWSPWHLEALAERGWIEPLPYYFFAEPESHTSPSHPTSTP